MGWDDVVREESEEQRRDGKEEFGERKTTRMHDPRQPSQHERIEHEMTHRPFRSWCNIASREEDERECLESVAFWTACSWGDEMEGNTLAFLVARERATRAVLSTVVPRRSTGEWICRRLLAWLREIGEEFVVKSDNELALTSVIESWSTLSAMKS